MLNILKRIVKKLDIVLVKFGDLTQQRLKVGPKIGLRLWLKFPQASNKFITIFVLCARSKILI